MTKISHQDLGLAPSKYLCLTILGYRKPGMSEEAYRRHMIEVSAPLTKDLMVKYGVKRWTVIHNPVQTRNLMTHLFDRQMSNVADYDCFSQVVFESLEHYKMMKQDPWYKTHLFGDHENFADTKKSLMTIGWIEEWSNDGQVRDSMNAPWVSFTATNPDRLPTKGNLTKARKRRASPKTDHAGVDRKSHLREIRNGQKPRAGLQKSYIEAVRKQNKAAAE